MKNFSKFLIGGMALGSLAMVFAMPFGTKKVYAADITPPTGVMTVEGATLRGGVYYINSTDITLNIDVEDDLTAKENIKMIISSGEVSGTFAKDDANWEAYTPKKKWNLENYVGNNVIYLYLKDESNNISPNIVVDTGSTFTVTYSGLGENLPAPQEAEYGMPFNVAIQEPTYNGKYFMGWSLTEGGSVQWLSDGIIEPKYIYDNITLYAIYANEAPSLASQVQIGDYVDYPVYYENVATTSAGAYKSTYTGWRVLDVSGDNVKLISAGTPLQYNKVDNSSKAIEALTTNFLTTQYAGNGFSSYYINLEKAFGDKGAKYTESVRSVTKEELEKVVKKTLTYGDGVSSAGSLLHNSTYYWLASASDVAYLWFVHGGAGDLYYSTNTAYGVRPVVSLKSSVTTSGRSVSGVWQLDIRN